MMMMIGDAKAYLAKCYDAAPNVRAKLPLLNSAHTTARGCWVNDLQ